MTHYAFDPRAPRLRPTETVHVPRWMRELASAERHALQTMRDATPARDLPPAGPHHAVYLGPWAYRVKQGAAGA